MTIVRHASCAVESGSVTALLGHNGVGKTTLLKTIMGILPAQEGVIAVDDVSIEGAQPHKIASMGIAYVPQDAPLFADLTVKQNFQVAYRPRGGFDAALSRALEPFPFLRDRLAQPAGTLSGGQQKMLLVARALLVSPRLLIVDEVTEGVQPAQVTRIKEVLGDLNASRGTTIFLVEQNIDFALDVADQYLVMKQGTIGARGASSSPGSRATVEGELALV